MIKKLLYHFLERRHFWRYVGFDQLSELYTSMLLRSMGLNLIGVFVPIYLYLSGYDLVIVMWYMALVFIGRMVADVVAGFASAYFGPKRVILVSNIFQIISLSLLLSLPEKAWPLWLIALTWSVSLSFFYVAYHISFSKIINRDFGGKELGIMTMVERLGAVLGPLAGGLLATMYGADKTLAVAIFLFILSSLPLFLSPEPTRIRQKITFHGLSPRRFWRDYVAHFGLGYDNTIITSIWPLYIGAAIFVSSTYAGIGLVTSLGVIAAIVSAKIVGGLVDRRHGRALLRWSLLMKSVANVFRVLVVTPVGVAMVNIAQEAANTGTRITFSKGMYDRSDSLPGYRIAYIITMEVIGDLGKAVSWMVPIILSVFVEPLTAMIISFGLSAIVIWVVGVERFPALNPRRFL